MRKLSLTGAIFINDLCSEWVDNDFKGIDGVDENWEETSVEIDDFFFHHKNQVGRMGPNQWVFGGVQRGTKVYLFFYPSCW